MATDLYVLFPPHHSIGNIESLKDLPLTSLILSSCYKLEGEFVGGLVGGHVGEGHLGLVLPQDNTLKKLSRNVLHSPHPLPHYLMHLGDISVFKEAFQECPSLSSPFPSLPSARR